MLLDKMSAPLWLSAPPLMAACSITSWSPSYPTCPISSYLSINLSRRTKQDSLWCPGASPGTYSELQTLCISLAPHNIKISIPA